MSNTKSSQEILYSVSTDAIFYVGQESRCIKSCITEYANMAPFSGSMTVQQLFQRRFLCASHLSGGGVPNSGDVSYMRHKYLQNSQLFDDSIKYFGRLFNYFVSIFKLKHTDFISCYCPCNNKK